MHMFVCFMDAGLPPRKIGEVVHCSRTLHVYESMESYIPFH